MEIAQCIVDRLLLGLAQGLEPVALRQSLVGIAKGFILADLGAVFSQFLQATLVNLTDLVVVHHPVEVGDDGPGIAEAVLEGLQRLGKAVPGRRLLMGQFLDPLTILGQDTVNGRFHLFRVNGIELGQKVLIKRGLLIEYSGVL